MEHTIIGYIVTRDDFDVTSCKFGADPEDLTLFLLGDSRTLAECKGEVLDYVVNMYGYDDLPNVFAIRSDGQWAPAPISVTVIFD